MGGIAFSMIVALFGLGGCIFLQVFLSKKSGKLPGLILPVLGFCYALAQMFSFSIAGMTPTAIFGSLALTFLLSNIPTILFSLIYWNARMGIILDEQEIIMQDLE